MSEGMAGREGKRRVTSVYKGVGVRLHAVILRNKHLSVYLVPHNLVRLAASYSAALLPCSLYWPSFATWIWWS